MFALNAGAVLNTSFSSSIASETSILTCGDRGLQNCHIERLPREVLLKIFMLVIQNDDNDFRWIGVFSSVCRHWYSICNHPTLWDFAAKRMFVIYPFVMRLRTAPWDPASQEFIDRMRSLGAVGEDDDVYCDPMKPMPSPSRYTLTRAVEKVKRYRARNKYYRYVQRRRSLVLHIFLSITLLFLSTAILTALLATEGYKSKWINRNSVFYQLYVCYTSIASIIISNVVMQAHFEPQPLLLRLKKNRMLIIVTAVSILLGVCDIIVPTILLQINLNRERRFSWMWCGVTVILSFVLWQVYVLMCLIPEAKQQIRQQKVSFSPSKGIQFVILNIPNGFPLLFAISSICGLNYMEYQSRFFILISCFPAAVTLGVLSLVCFLDYSAVGRSKDLVIGVCLSTAMLFPISLMLYNFRGLSLLPLALSSFLFLAAHFWFALRKAWGDFRAAQAKECIMEERKSL
ncbi:hypothetical protein AGDE_10570 [Angomonas deanei]|uniref:F-box domain/F-box-like, putative n=1 Tax=Angomonas deanei TaxID=59799 RepID=S9VLJ8_9TRYP|nr:hypothetical protein AGDE_12008 [Angomonas deanei]EPY28061.1 hypothetical protein AGDE_10570 [Angomonas deanei]CAD2221088.1 F-box domain/F-box-like, putative [Angomonas deanei]|eukprot:EPY25124.1 hypothetical protein AGDE_12008 [Angomonas deanei]